MFGVFGEVCKRDLLPLSEHIITARYSEGLLFRKGRYSERSNTPKVRK